MLIRSSDSIPSMALVAALCFFVLVSSAVLIFWPWIPGREIMTENGPVETLGAVFWGIAAGTCVWLALYDKETRADCVLLSVLFLVFMLRELEFEERFTAWNLGKLSNYLDSDLPIHERLLGFATFLLPLFSSVSLLIVRRAHDFLAALRHGLVWARMLSVWFVLMGLAVGLDKVHHVIELSTAQRHVRHVLEEVLETANGLMVALWVGLLAVSLFRARQSVPAVETIDVPEVEWVGD